MVAKRRRRRGPVWNAQQVRALRQYLGLTQEQMAAELGSRQQTISEWETSQHQPRGTSSRLLTLIAEREDFPYRAEGQGSRVENQEQDAD
jgi:DNA-binding transcriptional regulator YiaG